jgi:hypothetical protein
MDQQAMSMLQSVSNAARSVTASQEQIVAAISEQRGSVQDNLQLLGELSRASQASVHLISEIKSTIETIRNLELEKRATEIVEVVESQRKQLEASAAALHQTTTLTETLLTAQDSLHASVKKLHDTRFEETLKEFRDSLTALKPVLENLREPFILQAVPIRANGSTNV